MENEQNVHCLFKYRVELVVVTNLPHHRQEVRREGNVVVWVVERKPDTESVAHRGNCRGLSDEAKHLLVATYRVIDVFGAVIERSQRSERGNEHSHRVSVVVETVDKTLTHVFVNERVVRDVMAPDSKLLGGRKFAVKEEVGNFKER